MMTSEHKDYGQSRRQSTDQAPTILRHSVTKKKTVGGAGTPGDSGQKSNGEMQCVWALIDCGATSILMTPRLLK